MTDMRQQHSACVAAQQEHRQAILAFPSRKAQIEQVIMSGVPLPCLQKQLSNTSSMILPERELWGSSADSKHRQHHEGEKTRLQPGR